MIVPHLIFLILVFQEISGDCLENLQVIETQNTSATSLTLAWDYTCDQCSQCVTDEVDWIIFKIYWEHQNWMACDDNSKQDKDSGTGNREVKDIQEIVIDNLHPFSKYKITVKVLPKYKIKMRTRPEEKDLFAETLQGLPNVSPMNSAVPFIPGPGNLKISWKAPEQSNCEDFNAILDKGYFYQFKGNSPWNKDLVQDGEVNFFSKDFGGLMPFSQYNLSVYVRTIEGSHNPDYPLELSFKTEPAEQAATPRELTVVEINDGFQHRAGWQPPYPPTGIVDRYEIQWKRPNSANYKSKALVYKPFQKCVKTFLNVQYSVSSIEEYHTRICHTLNVTGDAFNRMNTTYRVLAFNEGSSTPSDPSNSVFPITEEEENMSLTIFLIVLGVILLILLISLAFIFIRKYNNRQL